MTRDELIAAMELIITFWQDKEAVDKFFTNAYHRLVSPHIPPTGEQ